MKRSQPASELFDGVVRNSLHVEHGDGDEFRIARLAHQDCAEILDHNREIMAAGGYRSTGHGMTELCIPELELIKLKRRYPDLASQDKDIRVKAWKRFIGSTEAKPWRVGSRRYS